MKARIITFGLISLFLLCGTGCEKMPTDIRNITLYNQPLRIIKHCIQGKWKVVYEKGGFIATRIRYWDDYYMEFTKNNRMIVSRDGVADYQNTKIRWYKECYCCSGGYNEYVYVAEFSDGSPPIVFDRIQNDTLIFTNLGADSPYYYLIKTK